MYAAGWWHLVSGHLDGPWEDMVAALVREAREKSGAVVDPADVRAAVTVHHRSPAGDARIGESSTASGGSPRPSTTAPRPARPPTTCRWRSWSGIWPVLCLISRPATRSSSAPPPRGPPAWPRGDRAHPR
ncbi:hypothetical protein [Streptomyces halstedii]|uniref:hypothetical protein n=1 Tax=Streptomyces halstedii TaxID=1944 RepID=UPI0038646FBF